MIDDRHDSNQELMGQGIANMVMGIFGGMPTTGVIARTATNVRSGAQTPVAGIIHSLTLLVILLRGRAAGKKYSTGGVERGAGRRVVADGRVAPVCAHETLAQKRRDGFFVRVQLDGAVDLPTAVGASLILASALLVKRLSETTNVVPDEDVTQASLPGQTSRGKTFPNGVLVFRIFGAFFFGAADKLETSLRRRVSCRRF
jgi:SulP family sulfate permease